MLQFATVLTTGGLMLFSTAVRLDQNIIINLVNRIIDSKNLQAQFIIDTLKINYLYDAILGLVFVLAWRKEIDLEYPQKLLQSMSLEWKNVYDQIVRKDDLVLDSPNFEDCWERSFKNWKAYLNKKEEQGRQMKTYNNITKGKKKKNQNIEETTLQPVNDNQTQDQNKLTTDANTTQETNKNEPQFDPQWQKLSPRQRFLRNQQLKKKNSKFPKKKEIPTQDESKKPRESFDYKVDKKVIDSLDRSSLRNRSKSPKDSSTIYHGSDLLEGGDQKIMGFLDSDDEEEENQQNKNSFLNKWVSKFKNVVGDKEITKDDLEEVLVDFKNKLMAKNVAQDVANQIAEAVGATLLQTKTKSFTSVHNTVKSAMKDALRKILTPKRKIDLVVEVTKQREKLKPYVIVFVGVNGVGKSTNLAKVAYKLKNAKLSVMLAACDNFRAGAVEQIETHGRNIGIPVFQKGYKEEPATIAYEAIKDATKKRIDAVLVDTAGRMQDNQPLMKELARLVKLNKPNLVVFIGEALVGNDAVDQITKFNKALTEESTPTFKPEIDAILLSKFDTVDDKVGTALSLVYSTSKPILYVGVGQKYPNLKELNVNTVVHALLS